MLVVSKKKSSGIRNIWRWIRVYGRCLAQVVCGLLNFWMKTKGDLDKLTWSSIWDMFIAFCFWKKWIDSLFLLGFVCFRWFSMWFSSILNLVPFVRILFLKILSNQSPIVIGSVNRNHSHWFGEQEDELFIFKSVDFSINALLRWIAVSNKKRTCLKKMLWDDGFHPPGTPAIPCRVVNHHCPIHNAPFPW